MKSQDFNSFVELGAQLITDEFVCPICKREDISLLNYQLSHGYTFTQIIKSDEIVDPKPDIIELTKHTVACLGLELCAAKTEISPEFELALQQPVNIYTELMRQFYYLRELQENLRSFLRVDNGRHIFFGLDASEIVVRYQDYENLDKYSRPTVKISTVQNLLNKLHRQGKLTVVEIRTSFDLLRRKYIDLVNYVVDLLNIIESKVQDRESATRAIIRQRAFEEKMDFYELVLKMNEDGTCRYFPAQIFQKLLREAKQQQELNTIAETSKLQLPGSEE